MTSAGCAKVRLSSSVTVARYLEMESSKDRGGIAAFAEERLLERYVLPVSQTCRKNGFAMVAVSCLLIETLESFYRGWDDTNGRAVPSDIEAACRQPDPKSKPSKGEVAFCYFFQRSSAFVALRPLAHSFYKHVRCGVLHQGETTAGWRVLRTGPMFDATGLALNASKLLQEVGLAVRSYAGCLRSSDWESDIWRNFRQKMAAIIGNCVPSSVDE